MPLFTLQYVYQVNDFSSTGGNTVPPNESGATALGSPPFRLTLNPGATTRPLTLDDDDSNFNEVGDTGQLLQVPITLNGVTYPVGTPVIVNYVLTTGDGFVGYSITLGAVNTGNNTTHAFITSAPMVPGQQYVFTQEANIGVDSIPFSQFVCFAAGTLINIPGGRTRVERLAVGDLVETRDHGPLPIRWVCARLVSAQSRMAPILIESGTLGATEDLFVSPNHRILVGGRMVELLTGETEVLVAAKHLVNGRTIRRQPTGFVTYVHFMFDRHEIVTANGCSAESFLFGSQIDKILYPEQVKELVTLFPALRPAGSALMAQMISRPEAHRHEGCLIGAAL